MIVVRTLTSPDGVVGLNGYWYLKDEEDELLKFASIDDAKNYISIQGADPDDEDLEYVDEQEDTKEREIEEWNY